MDAHYLAERITILQNEYKRTKDNITAFSEQLKQAKNHLQMVSGHINEVAFLLNEEKQKMSNSKEQSNGETINEESQQIA